MSDATDERREQAMARVAVEEIGVILTESLYRDFARAIRASDEAAGMVLVEADEIEQMHAALQAIRRLARGIDVNASEALKEGAEE